MKFVVGFLLGILLTGLLAGAAAVSRIECRCQGNAWGMCEPITGGFRCECSIH